MARLIVFGCSYAYGQGLEDCYRRIYFGIDFSKHSKLGWTQKLAAGLNLELVNKSFPGSSNFDILLSLLEFQFQKDDTVVIMWSHYLRDMIFTKFWKFLNFRKRLLVGHDKKLTRKWVEHISEQDYFMKTLVYMHHADLHLEKNNIKKYVHFPVDTEELKKYSFDFIKIENLHLDGINWADIACDNAHPGPLSNDSTFKTLYKILKNDEQ